MNAWKMHPFEICKVNFGLKKPTYFGDSGSQIHFPSDQNDQFCAPGRYFTGSLFRGGGVNSEGIKLIPSSFDGFIIRRVYDSVNIDGVLRRIFESDFLIFV